MLRALVERQKQELKDKERIIEERDAKIRKQNIQIDNMIQALLHARKKLFGPSTEINKQVDGQLSLFETVQELAEALELSKEKLQYLLIKEYHVNLVFERKCWQGFL